LHGTEPALGFVPRDIRIESLPDELLPPQLEMQRDLGLDVPPADVATAEHEIEEPAHAGPDLRHDD
jgi:hypothetical protein